MTIAPGLVRDAIVGYLEAIGQDASIAEIYDAVVRRVGDVPPSSVRSYLNLNAAELFECTDMGRYRLRLGSAASISKPPISESVSNGRWQLIRADCFEWLSKVQPCSMHVVVTDPPYGLVEYSPKQQAKLR